MEGFHYAVVTIERHYDSIALGVASADDGDIGVLYDLVKNAFSALRAWE